MRVCNKNHEQLIHFLPRTFKSSFLSKTKIFSLDVMNFRATIEMNEEKFKFLIAKSIACLLRVPLPTFMTGRSVGWSVGQSSCTNNSFLTVWILKRFCWIFFQSNSEWVSSPKHSRLAVTDSAILLCTFTLLVLLEYMDGRQCPCYGPSYRLNRKHTHTHTKRISLKAKDLHMYVYGLLFNLLLLLLILLLMLLLLLSFRFLSYSYSSSFAVVCHSSECVNDDALAVLPTNNFKEQRTDGRKKSGLRIFLVVHRSYNETVLNNSP